MQALGTKTQQSTLHEGDHHLIERHKGLLPAFEDENDDCGESNIDVGVDVDQEEKKRVWYMVALLVLCVN